MRSFQQLNQLPHLQFDIQRFAFEGVMSFPEDQSDIQGRLSGLAAGQIAWFLTSGKAMESVRSLVMSIIPNPTQFDINPTSKISTTARNDMTYWVKVRR